VLSPFGGRHRLEMGRRFVGVELKESYWRQAVANLRVAEKARGQAVLFP
jgi:hypothetical protein